MIEEQSKNEGKKRKNDTGTKNRPTSANRAISTERENGNRKVRKQLKIKQIPGSAMDEAADGMTGTRSACTVASFGQCQHVAMTGFSVKLVASGRMLHVQA